jgi:hypothetical protein
MENQYQMIVTKKFYKTNKVIENWLEYGTKNIIM